MRQSSGGSDPALGPHTHHFIQQLITLLPHPEPYPVLSLSQRLQFQNSFAKAAAGVCASTRGGKGGGEAEEGESMGEEGEGEEVWGQVLVSEGEDGVLARGKCEDLKMNQAELVT